MAVFEPLSRTFLLVCAFVLFSISAWLIGVAVRSLMRYWMSRGWRETTGEIVVSAARPSGSMAGADGVPSGLMYALELVFSYEVNGKQYRGVSLDFGQPRLYRSAEEALSFLSKLPDPHRVAVWYSPEHPEDSVLFRRAGFSWPGLLGTILGGTSIWLMTRVILWIPAVLCMEEQ
jgi:hypothetical protein